MASLQKQLEEALKLKGQAEKSRDEVDKAKDEVDKAWDKAEQHGYDVEVAETEDALRVKVPAVCRTYCAQTGMSPLTELKLRPFLS